MDCATFNQIKRGVHCSGGQHGQCERVESDFMEKIRPAFLGLPRTVDEGIVPKDGDVNNPDFDLGQRVSPQNLLECVKAVLDEFQDVFQDDLPKGTPPV